MRSLFSTRTPPCPHLLRDDGSYDGRAVMALAHVEARANVARAAARGVVRRYAAAFKLALRDAWSTGQTQAYCHRRDAAADALPAAHAAILAERTAALRIDSDRRMVAELAAVDARAAAMGLRL